MPYHTLALTEAAAAWPPAPPQRALKQQRGHVRGAGLSCRPGSTAGADAAGGQAKGNTMTKSERI